MEHLDVLIVGAGLSGIGAGHPGGIKTNIARSARMHESAAALSGGADPAAAFDRIALTSPEKAARQIVSAVQNDRRRVLVGPDAKLIDLASRLPASFYQRVLVQGAKRRRR